MGKKAFCRLTQNEVKGKFRMKCLNGVIDSSIVSMLLPPRMIWLVCITTSNNNKKWQKNISFQLINCLQIIKSISQMESHPRGIFLFSLRMSEKKATFKVTSRCEYFITGSWERRSAWIFASVSSFNHQTSSTLSPTLRIKPLRIKSLRIKPLRIEIFYWDCESITKNWFSAITYVSKRIQLDILPLSLGLHIRKASQKA